MEFEKIERIKSLIMFVVAWLIALYVYEVVQESFHGAIGLAAAVLTAVVNIYARRKAARCVGPNFWFKFWLFMPVILFFAIPIAVKVIIVLTSKGEKSWWNQAASLLPFILKLGVPVAALLWAYVAMGRLRSRNEPSPALTDSP